jgi:hypothetical protein
MACASWRAPWPDCPKTRPHTHTRTGASSWFFGAVQYPSAYSNPSAPGLLLASGNVAGPDAGLDDNDGCA